MRCLFAGFLVLTLFIPTTAFAQAGPDIRLTAPVSGSVLQGSVEVTGTSAVDGFFAAEISFSYASDPTSTWFLIYSTDQPVTNGLLTVWNTNLVTDGDYTLRLHVTLQDGTILETLVTGLRIRNQIPTETAVSTPTLEVGFFSLTTSLPPTPMPAPTSTRQPTPTSLPSNPATVTPSDISYFLERGIVVTVLTFLIIGIFLRLRRN